MANNKDILYSFYGVNPDAIEWLIAKCRSTYWLKQITCQGCIDGTWDLVVWR